MMVQFLQNFFGVAAVVAVVMAFSVTVGIALRWLDEPDRVWAARIMLGVVALAVMALLAAALTFNGGTQ